MKRFDFAEIAKAFIQKGRFAYAFGTVLIMGLVALGIIVGSVVSAIKAPDAAAKMIAAANR